MSDRSAWPGELPPQGPGPLRSPQAGRRRSDAAPTAVREVPVEGPVPFVRHPGWAERFPWLVQGTTVRGEEDDPSDLALFGAGDPAAARVRWGDLVRSLGMGRAVHARQVHGAEVGLHRDGPPGLHLLEAFDGHATRTPGVLLGVTVADCVPVSVVDGARRVVAVLHAGWRGAAAGILEAGLRLLADRLGSRPASLAVHLGPAICGECYEVGPEVHEALGLEPPGTARPVDLRGNLARRAVGAGVPPEAVSV
ncbi:MAG TPA: polyphenol oxidase family protein, partial [Longimicrobiales bacterium]|nr:polyphenol oxidase family protein [Longimicrobiales bacterium]